MYVKSPWNRISYANVSGLLLSDCMHMCVLVSLYEITDIDLCYMMHVYVYACTSTHMSTSIYFPDINVFIHMGSSHEWNLISILSFDFISFCSHLSLPT